jgi:hypothetical protein
MATTQTPNEKLSTDLGSYDVPRIGTASTGAVHYLDEDNGRVIVPEGGDVDRVQELDGRPVQDWISYVEARRGWAALGFEEQLAYLQRIADAQEDA